MLAWRDQQDDTFVVVHDVIVIAAPSFVFAGTVLRMWDSMAEADKFGEFVPETSREEMHRLRLFFTLLDRRVHAATEDRELYYLRVAQGWFMLSVGSFLALTLAAATVIGD